jgi:predicted RNase H-like nuclease
VLVAGVDGTKGGWVAIVLDDGRFVSDVVCRPVEADFNELANAAVIAIDVPIGFGPRAADRAARMYLAGARGTVFTTPSREVLERPYGPGLGVSAQAHALGPRIIHLTRLARADSRFPEVHPEVSFRALAGAALAYAKTTWNGQALRRRLLHDAGIELPDDLGEAAAVPPADVLDAAAAAWSAGRYARGEAASLPPGAKRGARQVIWY